jgi:hypothetical protein
MNAHPWQPIELTLRAARAHAEPYSGVDCWVEFVHDNGTRIKRPAFWDGDRTWRVRFAAPFGGGVWRWRSAANVADDGFNAQAGAFEVAAATAPGRFATHGFLRMSPGGRNVIHADGRPFLLAADTAWALPWRATEAECEIYAAKRQSQGFNAVLLMTVQPDMRATGPRDRTQPYGFDVGFEDLPEGRLTRLNPAYFKQFDRLVAILLAHEIVPVYQPVFHGYGWKGLSVAGPVVPGEEYARYCRYLVARFGAQPAIWLVGGDGHGLHPQINDAGHAIEHWDDYAHPTGIHYCPHAENRAWQEQPWLDFQWCQTGHNGEHVQERVADMWRNTPLKAIANGEPTYENIGRMGKSAGWWQGHEAWSNLCAGGTMGVVYGAGSLWQWRHADEPGHEAWAHAPNASWRDALDFEGANYIGVLRRLFDDLPFADMQPNWTWTYGRRSLSVPGKLYVTYLFDGGVVKFLNPHVPPRYRVFDARTGAQLSAGSWSPDNDTVETPPGVPCVVICA